MRKWISGACITMLTSALVVHFFVTPSTAAENSTDAVVVLAGARDSRLPVAIELAERGSGVLVVSDAGPQYDDKTHELCERPPDHLVVHCFAPAPSTTRGEARGIGRLVADRRWSSVTVVTNDFHVTRAGLLIDRCTDAEVHMADASMPLSAQEWIAHLSHELGGLAQAGLQQDC